MRCWTPEEMSSESFRKPCSTRSWRTAVMAELSDAFLALPGGFGTLEEFMEIITWSQLGLHGKPCGLLNVNGYYDRLLDMCDHGVAEGFIAGADRARILADSNPGRLLEALISRKVPGATRWIRTSEV